jgi:multidrug resistance efflux pump
MAIETAPEKVSSQEGHSEDLISVGHHPSEVRDIGSLQGLVPTEVTGATFPSLYLVRSSWLARTAARVTFSLLILSTIALVFVPWQQSSRGTGTVIARDPQKRLQPVVAMADGVVDEIKEGFQEGSHVVEGEVLMRLKPFADGEMSSVRTQLAQLENKKLNLVNNKENEIVNIVSRQAAGVAELQSVESEIDAAQAKFEQAKAFVEEVTAEYRAKKIKYDGDMLLLPEGLKSPLEVAQSEADEKSASQKVAKARQAAIEQESTLKAKRDALESKKKEVDIKNNEAQNKLQEAETKINEVNKEIEDVRIKLQQLDRLEVSATRTGIIQSLHVNSRSDSVKKNDVLFEIVPETDELAVKLSIRGNDSPLIHVGDEVRLQFQGWPAIQWVGWPSVAVGTFGGRVNSINPGGDTKGDFDVYVTPDGSQVPWPDNRYLRQGVRANGWVLLRTVPLGFELWRQLNGFPPMIDDPSGKGSGKDSGDKKDDIKKPKLPK